MKTIIPAIIFLSILFCGCSPSVNFMKYIDENYPPTNSVEVLRSKPASRDYIELGELSLKIKKSNEDQAVLKLKEKAKEIGADAIILLGENSEGSVLVPIGNLYASVDMRYIKAIAIKYKK
jgi:hypothetical protein